ncbi:peroxidase P7-like [Pyrus ussuriensis x Pyrus communis]|uniref:peroxidase n=1 Tax=Pyrus ussuriensis x Pyrus communis TaxID=2448454 RepID=A0A5N5HFC1_9ROSA|nr:peroxidase P7-like [Pyrus ussuriensis x Pyrus communis]
MAANKELIVYNSMTRQKEIFRPIEQGAHTFGRAHCVSFYHRVKEDKDLNVSLAENPRTLCPNGMMEMGLLHSDQQLMSGKLTSSYVRAYAKFPDTIHSDFAQAMQKRALWTY